MVYEDLGLAVEDEDMIIEWGNRLRNNQEDFNDRLAAIEASFTGFIIDYAGAVAPDGWLLCNGAAVSRTTYPALYAAIGTTWGVGDGVTTFNLPDLRGRCTAAAGTGDGLTERTLGEDDIGEEDHVLVTGEIPAHTHGAVGNHSHTFSGYSSNVDSGNSFVRIAATAVTEYFNYAGTHSHDQVGLDVPHNNMQPSVALNKIIRI